MRGAAGPSKRGGEAKGGDNVKRRPRAHEIFGWAAAVLIGAGCAKRTTAAARYEQVRVARADLEVTIEATGVIRPQTRLEIRPSVAGRIEEILVNEGDAVRAGQVLAWMSSSDRAALLDAARARGSAELARWMEIYKPTPLVAPLDGTVIARTREPGQTATLQDAILVLADFLLVEAQVDETDLAHIHVGQEAVVTLDAYPDRSFPARVTHIAYESETVDNVTIYKVRVRPENMPDFVRSGMTASVTFRSSPAQDVLVVPAEAVLTEGGACYVLTPGPDGAPARRALQVGLTDGRRTEVRAGLAEGDVVLVPTVQGLAETAPTRNPFLPPLPGARRTGTRPPGRETGPPPP